MNFDHLQQLGGEVETRFDTLLKNVMARSNSFYDAYLDLQEAFVKEVLKRTNHQLDESKNSGYLLHGAEVKTLLHESFGVPSDLVEKLHDHTLKANKHKHEKEKTITIDSVNAFMEPFYVFSRLCVGMTAVGQFAYDPAYFASLFGSLEKENQNLMAQVNALLKQAEEMAVSRRITADELEACKGLVSSLNGEKEDLQIENEQIKHAITFLQSITAKRIDRLEKQVVELDAKIAAILNAASPPRTASGPVSPIPKRNPTSEETAVVNEFFRNAKVYFMDDPNGRINFNIGRMIRRGIVCGIAGLVTFIISLCLPDSHKAFCIVGLLTLLYGAFMTLIGFKTTRYEMQDPDEFWNMARGEATFDGRIVVSSFSPARWKWITTVLFFLSLFGTIWLLFSSSALFLANQTDVVAALAELQSIVAIVIVSICMAVTGKKYEYPYVVFRYKDDVIRFNRRTGEWTARNKAFKGYRL